MVFSRRLEMMIFHPSRKSQAFSITDLFKWCLARRPLKCLHVGSRASETNLHLPIAMPTVLKLLVPCDVMQCRTLIPRVLKINVIRSLGLGEILAAPHSLVGWAVRDSLGTPTPESSVPPLIWLHRLRGRALFNEPMALPRIGASRDACAVPLS